jgi:predicted TIM-barrel fold metal-dependent hydrolase
MSMVQAVAGMDVTQWRRQPFRFADMRPGCYEPRARVADMDVDGVASQVTSPSFVRLGGALFLEPADRDLALQCLRAWNDFVLDEWCATAPDRFVPVAIAPLWDPELAAAEVARTAARGARMLSFVEDPTGLGLPSLYTHHWDPLLRAVLDADLALSMHFGSSSVIPFPVAGAPNVTTQTLLGTNAMAALTHLVFSGLLQRFPSIRIVLSESGIGWVPYLLERLDQMWFEHRHYQQFDPDTRPSDLFRRNVWVCSVLTEEFGMSLHEQIGTDRILVESDYPHADSRWPHTRDVLARLLRDVDDDDARAIAGGNARRVLGLEPLS